MKKDKEQTTAEISAEAADAAERLLDPDETGDVSVYDGAELARYSERRAERNAKHKDIRERLSLSHTLFTLLLTLSLISAVVMIILGGTTLGSSFHDLSIGLIVAGLTAMLLLLILTFIKIALYDALFTAEKEIKSLKKRLDMLDGGQNPDCAEDCERSESGGSLG